MFSIKKIGNVVKNHEDIEIEWKIINFFAIAENEEEFTCPTFSFMDTTWHFRMHPKSKRKPGFVNLYLVQVGNLTCSVEYCFGLKKLDGSVSGEHLRNGILTVKSESRTENGILHRYADSVFFKLLEVEHRKSELLLPSDTLTVICILKREIAHSHRENILKPHKLQKFTKLETLSEDFKSLLLNKEGCDTTLFVKDKEYKAHRAVLMARSSVFCAMFQHETSEKQTGIVNIPDCDPESFGEFLEFLYTGKLEQPSPQNSLHLYETSEKYNVEELKTLCSEFLMGNLTIEILYDAASLADKYDDAKLLSAVQCIFTKNLSNILVTPQWECFMKNNHRLANKLLIAMSSKVKSVD